MPSLLLYLQYRPVQTDAPATGAANIVGLKFSCLFERAEIQIPVNKFECPQRLSFSPGNREVHSPITTPEIISVMALTLQPIRGSPQHSGETGTRLSTAIHRRLLSRFFLTEGGTSVHRLKVRLTVHSLQPITTHTACLGPQNHNI